VGQIYVKKRGVHPSKSPEIPRIFATFWPWESTTTATLASVSERLDASE